MSVTCRMKSSSKSEAGNPQSEWDLSGPGSNIEGFTTDISVNHGDTVDFKINTNSAHYRIDIYRLGYYGGDGARLVADVDHLSDSAVIQPAPLTDAATGLVDAGSARSASTWDTPPDAVSGVYIAKLVREDGTPGENHIPFLLSEIATPNPTSSSKRQIPLGRRTILGVGTAYMTALRLP